MRRQRADVPAAKELLGPDRRPGPGPRAARRRRRDGLGRQLFHGGELTKKRRAAQAQGNAIRGAGCRTVLIRVILCFAPSKLTSRYFFSQTNISKTHIPPDRSWKRRTSISSPRAT